MKKTCQSLAFLRTTVLTITAALFLSGCNGAESIIGKATMNYIIDEITKGEKPKWADN